MYRSIFIDLDDTVWAFTENARDTFQDMYDKYHFDRYFRSFSHFYTLGQIMNETMAELAQKTSICNIFVNFKAFCDSFLLLWKIFL